LGPQQGRVEDLRAVGGSQGDDALVALEPVHPDEDLVRLCSRSSSPPAEKGTAAGPADHIELVDEDDRRRHLLGLVEQVAHPAPTHDRLDKLRGREEKNGTPASPATARATSVFPVPGVPESNTPRGIRAPSPLLALRVAEEVDDLSHLVHDLVDPGDVGEPRPRHDVRPERVARDRPQLADPPG
jgi:hypothetical protein